MTANGDGEIRSPAVKLTRPGCYTYRERLVGSPLVDEFTTQCPLAAQTALIAPQIITGGADAADFVAAPAARGSMPTCVQLASAEIDAAVLPIGIDLRHGALGTRPLQRQHRSHRRRRLTDAAGGSPDVAWAALERALSSS